MRHYKQPLRAAVTAALMLAAVMRAGVAGPLEDARLLADQGDADAQQRLGSMYESGRGVPNNYVEAVTWYRRAADQDFKIAQWNLGSMYESGRGVPKDYVQAHMWYNLSATQGFELAVAGRDRLEALMTPAQIAQAQKLARDWKPKSRFMSFPGIQGFDKRQP